MNLRRAPAFVAFTGLIAALAALPLTAQRPVTEKVDRDTIARITEEGLQRSKVMEIASYLTDVYGPRLTGSPDTREAADWTVSSMKDWGLANVHLESWTFGRGWQNRRFAALAMAPRAFPLIGYPKAWTPGTDGPITGQAVLAVIQSDKDFDTFRGTLRGKFVLSQPTRDVPARFDPPGRRYSDAELAELAKQPASGRGRGRGNRRGDPTFARKRTQFWVDEGVAAVLDFSGDGGTVFVQSERPRQANDPPLPVEVTLAIEHYGRIARMLERQVPVTLQMDVANVFHDADLTSFNIVGDLPGTDKADEVVLIGAHFDSWHTGTGATDNAAGSAVMLEAMRILKAVGVNPRRTVRIGLWTGEEQGLLGSREYVKTHFGNPRTPPVTPDYEKFSGYFNLDNGTGAIRGVYLQGNEAVAPIFTAWMAPFKPLGMTTLTLRNTGGTDHVSFDAAGLPGFQFIQDDIEYDTRTHHSNIDTYERLQAQDLMRNAVIVASFAYHAAMREERLPRKPLAQPR